MSATAEKMPDPEPIRMTADEFLASTIRLGPGKHELIHGRLVAMAPASPTHGIIQNRLGFLLTRHFESHRMPCRAITEAGVIPRVRARTNVRVPDIVVTCGPAPSAADRTVGAPTIIIEVLSPSNRNDPDSSLIACANIPSVMEMLAVDSRRRVVEVWQRDAAGAWPAEPEMIKVDGNVTLASINCTLSPADIYAGTHLSDV